MWLAHHDTKLPPEIDTKDEIKLRDYMTQKYERKRWHAPPASGLAEKAKEMNKHSGTNASSVRRPVTGAFRVPGPPGSIPKIQVSCSNCISTSSVVCQQLVGFFKQCAKLIITNNSHPIQPTCSSLTLISDRLFISHAYNYIFKMAKNCFGKLSYCFDMFRYDFCLYM